LPESYFDAGRGRASRSITGRVDWFNPSTAHHSFTCLKAVFDPNKGRCAQDQHNAGKQHTSVWLDGMDETGNRARMEGLPGRDCRLAGPQELVHFFVRVDFICALQWHPTQLVAGRRVQCPASNSMGRVVGPLSAVSGFHGAGPVRRALGMRRVITARASANSRRARWAPRQ
jgi:hypothetical protein